MVELRVRTFTVDDGERSEQIKCKRFIGDDGWMFGRDENDVSGMSEKAASDDFLRDFPPQPLNYAKLRHSSSRDSVLRDFAEFRLIEAFRTFKSDPLSERLELHL